MVTAGSMRASPPAAARTAWASSSGPASLSRNPRAPAASTACTCSSRSNVVMTTTANGSVTPGPASRRVASTPSSTGMRTSSKQTSGRCARGGSPPRGRSTPRPPPRGPGGSRGSYAGRCGRSPGRRRPGRARSRGCLLPRRGCRERRVDRPAARRVRSGGTDAAEERGTLHHAGDPVTDARRRGERAVVTHPQADDVVRPVKGDVDPSCPTGVSARVGHGLLRETKDRGHGGRAVRPDVVGDPDVHRGRPRVGETGERIEPGQPRSGAGLVGGAPVAQHMHQGAGEPAGISADWPDLIGRPAGPPGRGPPGPAYGTSSTLPVVRRPSIAACASAASASGNVAPMRTSRSPAAAEPITSLARHSISARVAV